MYYMIFKRLAKAKRHCNLFHCLGAVSFWMSAIKHLKRGNRRAVLDNLIAMFEQFVLA